MNRRDVLTAGVGLVTMGTLSEALAGRPCPPTFSGAQPVQCPAPSGPAEWVWDVPSLQDETDFYTNIMGWTIPAGADDFSKAGPYPAWAAPTAWSFGDVHNATEGDDLWVWDQQRKRYGGITVNLGFSTQDWVDELLIDFKANLLNELDADDNGGTAGLGFDHMYGQGLAVIYNDTQDATILAVLNGLKSRIEAIPEYQTLDGGGTLRVCTWEGRGVARWTIVASYAAQATNDPGWIAIRDNLVTAYETSPDWEEGGVIANGGGLHFSSRGQTAQSFGGSFTEYDSGYRIHSTYSIGLVAEAMWRLYVQSGSTILRDRLVKMARFVQHYAHDPAWNWPHSGSRIGHTDTGARWHSSPGDGISATATTKDPVYDVAMCNTLVIGYKLTGDTALLDFAKVLFSRSNRFEPGPAVFNGGENNLIALSLNHVFKYVDTIPAPGGTRLEWNKGQLQYCYMIFENGGSPSVLA